jgi:hypothetical protein
MTFHYNDKLYYHHVLFDDNMYVILHWQKVSEWNIDPFCNTDLLFLFFLI